MNSEKQTIKLSQAGRVTFIRTQLKAKQAYPFRNMGISYCVYVQFHKLCFMHLCAAFTYLSTQEAYL